MRMAYPPHLTNSLPEFSQQDLEMFRASCANLMGAAEAFQKVMKDIISWADETHEWYAAADLWEEMHDTMKDIDWEMDRRQKVDE